MTQISVSVFQKTGRKGFHFIWKDPVTGKRKTKKSGFTKKREALRAAIDFEVELNRKSQPSSMLWSEFVAEYDRQVTRHQARATQYQVDASFTKFVEATGVVTVDQVPELVQRFKVYLLESALAPATQTGYLKHFRAAMNWAADNQIIAERISIKMPRAPETEMKGRPLTGAEYQAMLLEGGCVDFGETLVDFMEGLWLSGLRRTEAMLLSWDRDAPFSIDMSGEYPRYRIRNRVQKSKRAQLAPMTPDFIEFLMKREGRKGTVFNPMGRWGRFKSDGVGKAIAAIGESAGVVTDEAAGRHATCHDFRRSFGDRWSRKVMPADLKELMRHRSIETTMRYYVGRNVDDISARLHAIET